MSTSVMKTWETIVITFKEKLWTLYVTFANRCSNILTENKKEPVGSSLKTLILLGSEHFVFTIQNKYVPVKEIIYEIDIVLL